MPLVAHSLSWLGHSWFPWWFSLVYVSLFSLGSKRIDGIRMDYELSVCFPNRLQRPVNKKKGLQKESSGYYAKYENDNAIAKKLHLPFFFFVVIFSFAGVPLLGREYTCKDREL